MQNAVTCGVIRSFNSDLGVGTITFFSIAQTNTFANQFVIIEDRVEWLQHVTPHRIYISLPGLATFVFTSSHVLFKF